MSEPAGSGGTSVQRLGSTRMAAGSGAGVATDTDAASDVWEVFRQEKDGDPMRHAGSVRAPDAELATHYAREFYSRRQESIRLWIVPRSAISDVSDPDLLQPPLDRSFKKPGGYVMRDKLDTARRKVANPHAATPAAARPKVEP